MSIISLLLVFVMAIGANVGAFAAETDATERSYVFNEETGELRLYSEQWYDDLTSDINVDENDMIKPIIGMYCPRAVYEFILKIKSLYLDKSVNFDFDLFLYAVNLQSISVDPDHEEYTVFDNVLYSKDKKTLLRCPMAGEERDVTLAEECAGFKKYAFSWIDLENDFEEGVEGDSEYPNYLQKRINLILTRIGQFKELIWDIDGIEQYLENIYVPESQEEIDKNGYCNYSSVYLVRWIVTPYYYSLPDENSKNLFNYTVENKYQELSQKYSEDNIDDEYKDYMIYGDMLTFLIEEGYTDNLEDCIRKYGIHLAQAEDPVVDRFATISAQNIKYDIERENSVRPLSSFINDGRIVNGKCGENVYYTFNRKNGLLEIKGNGDMYSSSDFNDLTYTNEILSEYEGLSVNTAKFGMFDVQTVSVEPEVTGIYENTFYGCDKLKNVCLLSSDTMIGQNAFPKNDGLQILARKDSATFNTLNSQGYNTIPYSFTVNKEDKDKPMLAFDGKVVLSEDMWSCICNLLRNTDVQYIHFDELNFEGIMPEYVINDYDESEFNYKDVYLSVIKDGDTVRLGMIEEKQSFLELVEAFAERFVINLSNAIRAVWKYIVKFFK